MKGYADALLLLVSHFLLLMDAAERQKREVMELMVMINKRCYPLFYVL